MNDPAPPPAPQKDENDCETPTKEFYSGVLPRELSVLADRRQRACKDKYEELTHSPISPSPEPDALDFAVKQKAEQCAAAHQLRPFGIALSGGGIRSATFNLGVLQGLAERGLLPYVDYLSTVSGGGYIGSWFHGLVKRLGGDPAEAEKCLSPLHHSVPGIPDDDAISFLRKYSNYLAPNPGLFSVDTWVIGSIWLRNVLLNQLILLPAIASFVLMALIAGFWQQHTAPVDWKGFLPLTAAGLLLLITVCFMARNLRIIAQRSLNSESGNTRDQSKGGYFPVQIFISCLLISWFNVSIAADGTVIVLLSVITALFFVFQMEGGFLDCFTAQHGKGLGSKCLAILYIILMSVFTAATSTFFIWKIWQGSNAIENPWLLLTFEPPLVCLSIMAGVGLLIGLMGADYPDGGREWLSSIGSNLSMVCAAWIAFFALTVFGPWLVSHLLVTYSRTGSAAIATWAFTIAGGVVAGRSSSTNGTTLQGNALFRVLIKIAPSLFVIGYLLLISFGVQALIRNLGEWHAVHAESTSTSVTAIQTTFSSSAKGSDFAWKTTNALTPNWFESHLQDMADYKTYFRNLDADLNRLQILLSLLAGAGVVAFIASLRININEFSIHHFYKNRLVRCYMGASHGKSREPDARTGFDPQDDFPLASLLPDAENKYCGPYAILGATLNMNAGSELATQERKGSSFVFTPLYSGYEPGYSKEDLRKKESGDPPDFQLDGYRATQGYSSVSGPGIGTAMAISGAAANPSWGYHTSGPMAFLLTVFNVRLGWWLGNPRFEDASSTPGPLFSLKYLFMELAAQTTARTQYVNLSDGGHFENLGLYELVRRRCRYIIVGDAEQDGTFTFESLGGAIRKCRADFGVEITINPDPIRLSKELSSSAHCVVGSIRYPEPEQGQAAALSFGKMRQPERDEPAQGWLLYLKASLTGNEPADITQYQSAHKEFPHEPTSDEFYSESQFESYRRLGLHVARETFVDVDTDFSGQKAHGALLNLFQALTRKWYAPVSVTAQAGAALTDKYSELMRRLAEDKQLRSDFGDLLPGKRPKNQMNPALTLKSFQFGTEIIQLMEDIVNEYGFEQSENFNNPGVSGWVRVFRRWARSDTFYHVVWKQAKNDYQLGFQTFMRNLRKPRSAQPPPPSI